MMDKGMTLDPGTQWIGAEHAFELRESYLRFRKGFQLEGACAHATLFISGDSRYRLYVNGHFIAFGPARSYPWQQCVEGHEISSHLIAGDNIIAVWIYQPGYSHFSYVHREQTGLLAELNIEGHKIVSTDTTWKVSPDSSFSPRVARISIYGAGQEDRDMREEEPWIHNDYDDQHWAQARLCAGQGQSPWEHLQLTRALPYEQTLQEPALVAVMEGANIDPDTALQLDPHQWIRGALENSRSIEMQAPPSLPETAQGRIHLRCYDLGYSQVHSAVVDIADAQGGEIVLVSYFEKTLSDTYTLSDPETYCQMRMTDRYVLSEGQNSLVPFTPRGGRYILVGIVGPVKSSLQLTVHYRMRHRLISLRKPFVMKDEKLNRIVEMCWRTLQACLQDTLIDCPWREQAHWTGDGAISGRMIGELCGDTQPLRRMLELAMQDVSEDGVLPSVIPSEVHAYVVLAYNFSWVEALDAYIQQSHDTEFLNQCWPTLQKMLNRFHQDIAEDGLIRSQAGRRFFLDWSELSVAEPNAFYNLRYLYALQVASTLAERLGYGSDKSVWSSRSEVLAKSLRETFYRNGVWYDQSDTEDRSQHVASFLVLTGLVKQEAAKALLDEAVATSLSQGTSPMILSSPYIHYYLFEALARLGRYNDIHAIIRFRWGHWLDQGAVTTWENWEIDFPDGSACHSWSAHPLLYLS